MASLQKTVLAGIGSLCFVALITVSLFAAPNIVNISPPSGPGGTSVTITGTGFGTTQGSSTVSFASIIASVTSWSSTSIVATAPSLVGTYGSVAVVVRVGGVNSNQAIFSVTNPVILALSINSAPVNQEITINGVNFGSSQGPNSSVTFNNIPATPSSWSDTSIVTSVPTGATTGNIVVTANGIASAGAAFLIVPDQQSPGVRFLQGNYSTSSATGTSVTVPFPIEQSSGDLNAVVVSWQGSNSVTSVTDAAGNTYALAVGPTTFTNASLNMTQAIYYA